MIERLLWATSTAPFIYFILTFVLAMLGLILFVRLAASKSDTDRSLLGDLLSRESGSELDPVEHELVSVLTYDEQYRPFTNILGLVLGNFPVSRFAQDPDFLSSIRFLSRAACRKTDRRAIESAMCTLVWRFLEDPEIEYHCRPFLSRYVSDFLVLVDKNQTLTGVAKRDLD